MIEMSIKGFNDPTQNILNNNLSFGFEFEIILLGNGEIYGTKR